MKKEASRDSPDRESPDFIPAYKQEDLKLPRKFAEQVLELEMNVEHNVFTIKQIQRLMALYSKAVEFYNGKSDGKYLYYQDKIQNLITQPKVLDMLSSKQASETENTKPKKEKAVKTDPKTKEVLKKKERQLKMNLHVKNKEIEKSEVKAKLIEDHSSAQDKESKIIESNLSQQTDNLQRRLEARRLKMQKGKEAPAQKTESSTPNQTNSSSKAKVSSDGSNSLDEPISFQFNLNGLVDDKFSDELVNRLRVLQEGYDDRDYDDDDLFDEDAIETEIEQILNKCDEEVDKILEEDRKQIEDLYETIANEKFEKLAEIKGEYKYLISTKTEPIEIRELEAERDQKLAETVQYYQKLKDQRVKELDIKHNEKKQKIKIKRESIMHVTNRVRRSVSRKASRRESGKISPKQFEKDETSNFTNIMPLRNKEELQEDLSKGLNKNKEFSSNFTLPKGPINMNNLVRNNESD